MRKFNWLFFLNNKGFADGDDKTGDDKVTLNKEEYEALKSSKEKLEKDLEDVRMEVLTPEYSAFLDSLEKGEDKGKKKEEKPNDKVPDDVFEKMSKKELFEAAKKAALDELNSTLDKQRKDTKADSDARTKREIAAFAKTHDDFETFRPIMYGLSLDPKNADLPLSDLYTRAKEHVKKLGGASDEEKAKQARLKGEKPTGDSTSFEKVKKMSNESIAREALDEVIKELGPMPKS